MSRLSLRNLLGGATRSNLPQGIDVSASNGEFDWPAWKGHIEFGMAHATTADTYIDPQFERNWDTMGQMGLVRFAFHWFFPGTDPATQAKHFYDSVHELGLTEYDGLVVYLGEIDRMTPIDVSFAAWVFCQELEKLSDHQPFIYTYPAFADAGNCAKLGEYPLWVIAYDTPIPHVPVPWESWDFWQSSANEVGRDVFNGTIRELDKL